MKSLVPNRFLFDFELDLHYRAKLPAITGTLSDWSDDDLLPKLSALDDGVDFADVWSCWNESGLAIAYRVIGKKRPLRCTANKFWMGDNLRLCTDMRDARTNKRATRFCQQFYFMPVGGGAKSTKPVVGINPIKRARESAPNIDTTRIEIASCVKRDGYALEAMIPAPCLSGFNPQEHPRIGFYYMLEDGDHGQQFLTVGDDLSWHVDPSTWATAVLQQ